MLLAAALCRESGRPLFNGWVEDVGDAHAVSGKRPTLGGAHAYFKAPFPDNTGSDRPIVLDAKLLGPNGQRPCTPIPGKTSFKRG